MREEIYPRIKRMALIFLFDRIGGLTLFFLILALTGRGTFQNQLIRRLADCCQFGLMIILPPPTPLAWVQKDGTPAVAKVLWLVALLLLRLCEGMQLIYFGNFL